MLPFAPREVPVDHPLRKAVIPAAGLGTRFLPATKAVPKELLPIVDTPTIQYIVAEAVAAGVEEVILVSARGKESIVDHFDAAPELEAHLARTGKDALRQPRIFEILEKVKPGVGGELQLTDGLAVLAREEGLVGYRFEGERHDAGDRLGYLKANVAFALKRPDLREPLLAYLRQVIR